MPGSVSICAGKERPLCAAWHVQRAGAEAGTRSPAGEQLSRGLGEAMAFPNEGRRLPGGPQLIPGKITRSLPGALIPRSWGGESPAPGAGGPTAKTNACAERGRFPRRARRQGACVSGGGAGPRRGPFREPRPCRCRFPATCSGQGTVGKESQRAKGPLKGVCFVPPFYR